MRIRKVKNSAGNTSVQIGNYYGKNFLLVKHIGSAKTQKELNQLMQVAREYINEKQISLFNSEPQLDVSQIISANYKRISTYKYFSDHYAEVFPNLDNDVLKNLVIIRLIKPTSKLESIQLLKEYFGIKYSKSTIGRKIINFNKDRVIHSLVEYARQKLNFDFRIVFYDVTTLFFESKADENLRKPGYSKDGKHTQPQILIGLVVDRNGFPIYYEIFEGNKFEGHTMLPVILTFKEKFKVKDLIIVADSAMLSEDNLSSLEENNLQYIVGNRTHTTYKDNLKDTIVRLKKSDNSVKVIKSNHRSVIYHYSKKREKKDLFEINKAVMKALKCSNNPSKQSRVKFLTTKNQSSKLNMQLIEKHKFLAGIKSYKTNTNLPGMKVVERYSDLWKVEKAFRMSKHDLKARPVFHRREEAIQAHILIVFAANALSKHLEMTTGKSILKIVKEQMRIIDVEFIDKNTGKSHTIKISPH